ncbi:MAG: PaaI family thioesterase [Lutibacter sp.]
MENKELLLKQINKLCKNTLMETLDIVYTDVGEDYLVAKMPVTAKVYQPDGILNGGASMALAESVGSPASMLVIDSQKYSVRGISFSANHLRSVKDGFVTAKATFIHKGRTTHLLEIRITDDKGKLVSHGKLTNIILPK